MSDMHSKTENLQGQQFNRLRVVSFAGYRHRNAYWNCYCRCGNTAIVASRGLKQGQQSCGCANRRALKSVFSDAPDITQEEV